ncbi:MAG: hypothetical protein PWQ31_1428 [Eubacteriales bacterium]|nr:hypothetical protein [Eubacteriales bacterium]
MRMKILQRLLLALWGIAGAFLSIVLLTALIQRQLPWEGAWQQAKTDPWLRLETGVVAVVVLALALLSVVLALGVSGRKKRPAGIVFENKLGQLIISFTAVETLIQRLLAGFPGVKDVQPAARPVPEGIAVTIRFRLSPDLRLPEVSEEIQKVVREKVYEVMGITVREVILQVEDIDTGLRPRVE